MILFSCEILFFKDTPPLAYPEDTLKAPQCTSKIVVRREKVRAFLTEKMGMGFFHSARCSLHFDEHSAVHVTATLLSATIQRYFHLSENPP